MTQTKATATAVVYTRPGCMRCRIVERALTKLGARVETKPIDDHPQALQLMVDNGWSELPLVVVTIEEWQHTWAGLRMNELHKIEQTLAGRG